MSSQPNLVNGYKNSYPLNTGFQAPQPVHTGGQSMPAPPQVPNNPVPAQLPPAVDAMVPVSGDSLELFGQQVPKTYVYILGIILIGVVLYFLWNWYNKGKKNEEDEEDEDEDYNIPPNMMPVYPGAHPAVHPGGYPGMPPLNSQMQQQPPVTPTQFPPQPPQVNPNLEGRGPKPQRLDKAEQIPIHHGNQGGNDNDEDLIQDL